MRKLCIVLFAAILVSGCSAKEKKVICKDTEEGDEYVYEFNASGDTLNTHNIDVKVDLATWDLDDDQLTDENIEATKIMLDSYYIEGYMNLKGITTTSVIDEAKKYYTATIKIDFDQTDFEELEKADLVESDTKEISLEKTLEDYTGCEEQELSN